MSVQALQTAAPSAEPAKHAADDVVVLKFGSSILKTLLETPEAVSEIYRQVRQGKKVVAVVSAFAGVTDRLLDEARSLGLPHDNKLLPHVVSLGEEKAAALAAIACDRVGLDATALSVRELGLVAVGASENASVRELDPAALRAALKDHAVVVVPGFAGLTPEGRVVLLGRGGTDLTAAVIAQALGAGKVRLLKDVDGVFEADPAAAPSARHFSQLSYDQARQHAGKSVQARALDYAEAHGLEIEVAALRSSGGTVIGAAPGEPKALSVVKHPPLKVALAGAGIVGGGVAERLKSRPDLFELVAVLVRDPSKPRDAAFDAGLFVGSAEALFARQPDVLVDALSSGVLGTALTREALSRGVSIASANKQALAGHLGEFHALADKTGAKLYYSACVGGGAPLIEAVQRARLAGEIDYFEGLVNGTSNFILDRVANGDSFDEALAKARVAGFAEEDPSADLTGLDASAKATILAYQAFGADAPDAPVETSPITPEKVSTPPASGAYKQVARASFTPTGWRGEAHLVATDDPLWLGATAERNALRVVLKDGRTFEARGRGAGRWPTAESVLADLNDLIASRP